MKLFAKDFTVDICYEGKNPYVKKAIENLILDFERVNKFKNKPRLLECFVSGNILIHTEDENKKLGMGEGYSVKTKGDSIIICGAGYLGTIYGIYAFSQKVLGISPLYLFDDKDIEEKEELTVEDINIFDYPKTFKFRGMFINDEDILTDWVSSGKKRHMDYPFYQNVVDISVVEKITETAMRLKMNLIIPASFVDIDNPHEKEIIDCVTSHGIFVSQHHVEPCGVSHFGFDNYSKKAGLTGEASYFSNKENMIKVWKYYIEKWAKYDNVVWQLGHRGRADVPIWCTDKTISSDWEERGRVISQVYSLQRDMIMKVTNGKAKYFTSTLWMEGSELLRRNVLKFPEDTIIVLSDIGVNQMFGRDYDLFDRTDDSKRGIYYHSQFWSAGPHLAPGTGLDKMHYNLKKAVSNKDTEYIILNSSNIREFTFEIMAYSEMVWDFDNFSKDKYICGYSMSVTKNNDENISFLVKEYYKSFAVLDNEYLHFRNPDKFDYNYDEKPEGINNFQINDGTVWYYGMVLMDRMSIDKRSRCCEMIDGIYNSVKANGDKFRVYINKANDIISSYDEMAKRHLTVKWINPANTMMCLYKIFECTYEAEKLTFIDQINEALSKTREAYEYACQITEFRKCAEYGEFENWYRGDKKLDVERYKRAIFKYEEEIKKYGNKETEGVKNV